MQVLPYNRVVKDLGSHTPESLLAALRKQFSVKEGPATPSRKGEVAMFLGDRWYTIDLGTPPAGTAPDQGLDVSRLQDTVDRKSTRLNSSHVSESRMPSSA